ncbi:MULTISPECIES: helix-turn-helix transcriptional regulator [unclassified Rickettsia]|uniref:helix-turn-helix transcriptional regulator n=1 Tax=unclassified Rickettsia TaxID=114295 RepID=UPI0020A071D5|nr:helix-turn-helix transcriptional regulator [Rickettsia endosymbiont of Ceutorhynchus assimilis]
MSLATKIKKFLKEKFKEYELSRKDFAKESGVPYTTVTRIMKAEAGTGREFNPEIDTILKIADYFNCSMDEVIGRKVPTEEENN